MRLVGAVACVAFFAASGSAMAADCTKGLLWPYVRNPGDCLTDAEIATGRLGAFSGPVTTNPDVGAIKPAMPAQAGAISSNPAISSSPVSAAGMANIAPSGPVACNKGWLWPFLRDSGDCLTETERKGNPYGIYGGGTATQVSITQSPNAPNNVVTTAPASVTAPASTGCSKGFLWPFVRDSGDCQTEVERKSGAPATPVSVTQPASAPNVVTSVPASAAAPASAGCSRGWLWPFVRDSGDCQSEVERKSGAPATPVTVAQPASAPNAVTSVPASVAAPASAGCSKGFLWPFVRDTGDCQTDTEKRNGGTGVAGATQVSVTPTQMSAAQPVSPPSAPAASAPAIAPAASSASAPASCNKGLLWPFVRGAGDCPSDAQKK